MSSQHLTFSIDKLAISSAGASLTNSIEPWNPVLSKHLQVTTNTDSYSEFLFPFYQQEVPGGTFGHQFFFQPKQSLTETAAIHSLKARILSHFILNSLPDRALPELIDTLKTMIEFYREPIEPKSLPPQRKSMPIKTGKVYVRPEFHIVED